MLQIAKTKETFINKAAFVPVLGYAMANKPLILSGLA